jgi:hypothetical protein
VQSIDTAETKTGRAIQIGNVTVVLIFHVVIHIRV